MKKSILLLLCMLTYSLALEGVNMTVYKSPYCGCCTKWVDLMKEKGFNVKTVKVQSVASVNQELNVPNNLASCHTATVNGYVVIGHVNYSAIKKMLLEKKEIAGLSVPGMPIGSPGMEQGNRHDPYDVIAFKRDGTTSVFESHF